jgi:hypothetical protein
MSKIKLKRDAEDALKYMSDEEIIEEFKPRVCLDFEFMAVKYVFRNVDDDFMKDFSIIKFIDLLSTKIEWYRYSFYDRVNILGKDFVIIEATKRKMVLVRAND